MTTLSNILLAVAGLACSAQVAAQATFYEDPGFAGRSMRANESVSRFDRYGFNNRTSSVVVVGDRWEVCQDANYRGRCTVLRPGQYPSLAAMGLNDRVSSARAIARNARVDDQRYAPVPVVAQVTFYERAGFDGRSFTTTGAIPNFRRYGFNDRASSAVVVGERWEVCNNNQYRGRCVVLRPGRYPSLASMGLDDEVTSVRTVASNVRIRDDRYAPPPGPVRADGQVTFFERAGFQGRSFTTDEAIANLERSGFNDRAASAVVIGERWEVCNDTRYNGRCVVLRPGRYPSLDAMGMNDRISSVRTVEGNGRIDNNRYAPQPVAVYDSRRRNNERLYETPVTSARAVLATSGQRCWVEREQIQGQGGNANVPGALAGALIGGILGHQVGGGSGKDIATVGGVIAGAALGANVGRDGSSATQDVRRCENTPGGAQPAFWDVSYSFRGEEHRVQMATDPGRSITVNERGEPRQP